MTGKCTLQTVIRYCLQKEAYQIFSNFLPLDNNIVHPTNARLSSVQKEHKHMYYVILELPNTFL